MFSCSHLDKSRQSFYPWHLEVPVCPDNLATGSQITECPGAREFLCHKVQCKGPFLTIQPGSCSSYQMKAVDSMQRNNPDPTVQRRQQTWPYCLHFPVSLRQLCSWFGSTNTKIRMTKRLAWSLQNCKAFPVSDQKEDQIFTQKEDSEKGGRDRRKGERKNKKERGREKDKILPGLLCWIYI